MTNIYNSKTEDASNCIMSPWANKCHGGIKRSAWDPYVPGAPGRLLSGLNRSGNTDSHLPKIQGRSQVSSAPNIIKILGWDSINKMRKQNVKRPLVISKTGFPDERKAFPPNLDIRKALEMILKAIQKNGFQKGFEIFYHCFQFRIASQGVYFGEKVTLKRLNEAR
ncbi:hypothetical protein J437_LFUL011107 [Ladona fulva]|uniref:Uncharacterized protein n=1 Tax=Ladona fulva TaxID=123851 RepID=A0A8K0P5H6_LADFU|nr:hypothetical protein J437_LFUL011107 [Ladona fulva]